MLREDTMEKNYSTFNSLEKHQVKCVSQTHNARHINNI